MGGWIDHAGSIGEVKSGHLCSEIVKHEDFDGHIFSYIFEGAAYKIEAPIFNIIIVDKVSCLNRTGRASTLAATLSLVPSRWLFDRKTKSA